MFGSKKTYQMITYSNSIVLLGCVLYLFWGKETVHPSSVQADQSSYTPENIDGFSPNPSEKRDMNQAPAGIEDVFLDIMDPIKKAASDHNADASQFLPTEDEIAKAVGSNRLDSEASAIVIQKLKNGYAKYNMPFPSLDRPMPPSSNSPSGAAERGDPQKIEAWLGPTVIRMEEEAKVKNVSIQGLIPTKETIDLAIKSGSFDSPEFLDVLQMLQKGYQQLQIELPDPSSQSSGPRASSGAQDSAEKQIINAYFQGQLQRIKLEAKKKEIDISDCFPSRLDIEKAANSGAISSPSSLAMIAAIEKCYQRLDIPFYPPVQR